jgi:putative hydrolase of the HAD superfamily
VWDPYDHRVSQASSGRRTKPDRAVIFDADDTLWYNARLINGAVDKGARLVAREGIDPASWKKLRIEIDIAQVTDGMAFNESFQNACERAYLQLAGEGAQPQTAARLRGYAFKALFSRPELIEGVPEALRDLASDHLLVMLTKGEPHVQAKKVHESGLADRFQHVFIVDRKTTGTFAGIALAIGVPAERVVSIGNSLKSDVEPARAVGMTGVWIPQEGTFAYEDVEHADPTLRGQYRHANTITEALTMIRQLERGIEPPASGERGIAL